MLLLAIGGMCATAGNRGVTRGYVPAIGGICCKIGGADSALCSCIVVNLRLPPSDNAVA